jgi:hypothetical protein
MAKTSLIPAAKAGGALETAHGRKHPSRVKKLTFERDRELESIVKRLEEGAAGRVGRHL